MESLGRLPVSKLRCRYIALLIMGTSNVTPPGSKSVAQHHRLTRERGRSRPPSKHGELADKRNCEKVGTTGEKSDGA